MRSRLFSKTHSSIFCSSATSSALTSLNRNSLFTAMAQRQYITFRKFDPAEFQTPDQFKEYQTEITRLLRVTMELVPTQAIQNMLRCSLQNYHPEYIHHPAHARDSILAAKQYGALVWYTLSIAKEGLDIMNKETIGNPALPQALTKQHYEAILSIPALQHLEEHPEMKAFAKLMNENAKAEHDELLFHKRFETYAPLRLKRDW